MGLFSKLFSSPQAAPQAVKAGVTTRASTEPDQSSSGPRTGNPGTQNYFEALSETTDRTRIPLYSTALRAVLQGFNREKLAYLGRYLYDNDGNVSYAIDSIANYSVPIIPMASTKDAEANKGYEAYFDEWCKRSDFTGRFHFGMIQRLICKAFDREGDILPEMTAEHGFPQLRVYETWSVTSRGVPSSMKQCDGVGIDENGVVTGYWVIKQNDGLTTIPRAGDAKFISANTAVLLYDADGVASYRGLTPIRRGLNDVRDSKDIKGFSKLATKIGAALAAVIEGEDVLEENDWGNDTGNGDTDTGNAPPEDATQQEKKITMAELLGGDIPVLGKGKLHQLDNKQPGERVLEMLEHLGGCFINGLGVPSAFFLNKKATGPGQRGINGQAQRKFNERQEIMARFVEWVWVRVIAWGITYDGLPAVPGWNKCEWQGPPKVSIDDGADANAWREDVGCGLMTRQNHYANRQLNWQRETDQGFIEDDYILTKANALAKKQNVPVELILNRWGYAEAKKPQAAGGESDKSTEETQTQK